MNNIIWHLIYYIYIILHKPVCEIVFYCEEARGDPRSRPLWSTETDTELWRRCADKPLEDWKWTCCGSEQSFYTRGAMAGLINISPRTYAKQRYQSFSSLFGYCPSTRVKYEDLQPPPSPTCEGGTESSLSLESSLHNRLQAHIHRPP